MAQGDIKIKDWCEANDLDRKEVEATIKRLAIKRHKQGVAYYLTEKDTLRLARELSMPDELKVEIVDAFWVHDAKNPSWLFARIDGFEGKHPVLVPRRFQNKLKKKRFKVEVVRDKEGVTFRHEWFTRVRAGR